MEIFDWLAKRRFSRGYQPRTDSVPTTELKAYPSTTSYGTSIDKEPTYEHQLSVKQDIWISFLQLPDDLLREIASHLDPFSRVALRRTCHTFRQALSQLPSLTRGCIIFQGDDYTNYTGIEEKTHSIKHLQICEPGLDSQTAPRVMNNFGCIMDPGFDNLVSLDMCLTIKHRPSEPQNRWSGVGLAACSGIKHLTLRLRHVQDNPQGKFCPELFSLRRFYQAREFPELQSFTVIDVTPNMTKRYLGMLEFRSLVDFLTRGAPRLMTLQLPSTWRVDLHCYWIVRRSWVPRCIHLHSLSVHPSLATALCHRLIFAYCLHNLSLQASRFGKYNDIRRPLFTPHRFPDTYAIRVLKLTISKNQHRGHHINWNDIARTFPKLEQIHVTTPYEEPSLTGPRIREVFEKLPKLAFSTFISSTQEAGPLQHTFRATRDAAGSIVQLQHDTTAFSYTQALRSSWANNCDCELTQ